LEPTLASIAASYRANIERAHGASVETLTAFRDAGADLARAKDVLGRGKFGRWRNTDLKVSKGWASRLMELHRDWADVETARAWAFEYMPKTRITRNAYGVDGALALLKVWRERAPQAGNGDRAPAPRAQVPKPKSKKALAQRDHKITAQNRYIKLLQGMLHDLGAEFPPMEDEEVEVART
jgi:hypothetical protein